MPWPTVPIITTGMDADTDALPRSDILDLATKFNQLIAMRGVASGVCDLDGSGLVPTARLSANLAAEAGLAGVADRLSYYTGSGAKSLTGFTGFARTVLDDADAATARATLEVDQLAHWAWDSVRGRVPRTLTAGTGFDAILTPGVYNLDTTGSASAPSGLTAWCYVDVYRHIVWATGTSDYVTQVVRTMNGAGSLPRIWTRTYTQGSGWSSWFSLLHQRVWSGDVKASYPRDTTFSGSGIAYDRAVRIHTVNNAVGGHAVSATVDGVSIGAVGAAESPNAATHVVAQFIVPAYKSWSWTADEAVTVQSLYLLG